MKLFSIVIHSSTLIHISDRKMCASSNKPISFSQLRKLREAHEYTFARGASFSLRMLDADDSGEVENVTGVAERSNETYVWRNMKSVGLWDEKKLVRWADEIAAERDRKGENECKWDAEAQHMMVACHTVA